MPRAYVIGIFPRSPKLIKVWKRFERGEAGEAELTEVYVEHVKTVYSLQEEASLDLIHDPQSNWHDLFRPFTKMEGVEAGPLKRFYENNTFYKEPVVTRPRFEADVLDGYLARKVVPFNSISLPGPYTFVKLSRVETDPMDIANLLRDALEHVFRRGYEKVFLHEPEAVYRPLDKALFRKLYNALEGHLDKVVIHLYYGDASTVSGLLEDIGLAYTIDLAYTPFESLPRLKSRIYGAVAGDNTLMEDPREIVDRLSKVAGHDFDVVNNVDLDFLPYEYAVEKIRLLGRVKEVAQDA